LSLRDDRRFSKPLGVLMAKKQDYGQIDQLLDCQMFIESFDDAFRELDDPRREANQRYPLVGLMLVTLCAVLAGCNAITHIHEYACSKWGMLGRILGVETPPSYNTLWWLLTRLNPQQFQECFSSWVKALPNEAKERIISIDGKRLRGTTGQNMVHLVGAWESARGLLLGQVKTKKKSNEIKAIPELLDLLDIQDATVTIDAAGCQKAIADKICDQGGHYVLALKGNQGVLHQEAINFFAQAKQADYQGADCEVSTSLDKGHGRQEERTVAVTHNLEWLEGREDWRHLTSLIEVTSRRAIKSKVSEERRYYISDLPLSATRAGEVIRTHWGIENELHWVMDVVFLEDSCSVNAGYAPENLAILRRIAHALIKDDNQGKLGYVG